MTRKSTNQNSAYRLVKLTWIDSRSPLGGWQFIEGLEPPNVCQCVTVGYLLKSDSKVKVLAQTLGDIDDGGAQANGIMTIPSKAVIKIADLVEA